MSDRSLRSDLEALQVRVRQLGERDPLSEATAEALELEGRVARLEASNQLARARRSALEARRREAKTLQAAHDIAAADRFRMNESQNLFTLRMLSSWAGMAVMAFVFFKLEQAVRPFEPLGLINLLPLAIGLGMFARGRWLRARAPG